jgi:uncharacterized protein (TIGR00255 family)
MIKSMTGFAAVTRENGSATLSATVRAVNHRYLDVQLRLPSLLNEQETRIRAIVQQSLARGRVELSISVQSRRAATPVVELNEGFVASLEAALERARLRGLITGHLTPGDLLRSPHAITVRDDVTEVPEDKTGFGAAVEQLVLDLVAELERMRRHEGAHLREDLETRRLGLAAMIEQIAEAAQAGDRELQSRLAARVSELSADLSVDRAAIAQEIVRFVGRSDISEEVTRFRAHLQHWSTLVDGPEPCGRKLDFLLQEMNREVNTIGSKADGQHVSALIVTAKAELEKMREQVQNVE